MSDRRDFIKAGLLTGAAIAVSKPALAQNNSLQAIGLAVGGLQFDALSAGPASGELVLCLHGFPQYKESWIPVLQALGACGYHAVAVDQRGYSPGARPPNVSDYSEGNLVADVMGFAAALGASRFHLVGHDRGASVSWAVARNYPQALLTLTCWPMILVSKLCRPICRCSTNQHRLERIFCSPITRTI
jgi:alpha-beta hydrolase superfamily lysophospholipase